MRYGLRLPSFALGPRTASLADMGRYLRRAEDLGFESAVTIDHLLLTPPAYACTWLEPMTMLAALAGVTRTIRLGTMVLVLPLLSFGVSVPANGLSLPVAVPNDPTLCGGVVLVQSFLIDSGASGGVAESVGIRLVLGL